jgi:serine phosphatase RsbU (regulator of sigma subunit)/anti-sigma regulatory factor (Ser/Thr protein kinase)
MDLDEKIFDLEKRLESKNQETRDLGNVASVITSLLDIQSVLAASMEIGIRQVSGEVGAVLQVVDNQPELKVSWGVDSSLLNALIYKDDLDIVRYCLHHRKTFYDNGSHGWFPGQVSIRNFVCCPILSQEEVIGVMVVFNKESESGFTENDILILEMICKFASVAIENAKLLKQSLEKQKMDQELDLARQVQGTFLPENVDIGGFKIAASYIPAQQVGGDYYDLIPIGDQKLFFLIGDVTNKGVPAALVMTSVYSIVRSYVTSRDSIDVPTLMEHLNDILCNDIIKSHGMFITLFMAYIDLEQGFMEYCNGGHPPPFYYHASAPEIVPLKCGGPIVGQFGGTSYTSTRLEVACGDRVFCYTDGLIEAADRDGNLYGMNRLEQFFRHHLAMEAEQLSREIKSEIDCYSREGSVESIDDYTTLVIDIAGGSDGDHVYEYTLASHLESLDKMHVELDAIAVRHSIPENTIHPFRVAVSEAITNAIIHAHGGDSSKIIRFTVDLNDERIMAVITDEGPGKEIEFIDCADPVGPLDAEGGRGIGLIKRLSDEASLEQLPQGGMEVKIVKYISK